MGVLELQNVSKKEKKDSQSQKHIPIAACSYNPGIIVYGLTATKIDPV